MGLGDLLGGSYWSSARAVSDDGSIVVGTSVTNDIPSESEGFRWESGVLTGLGDFPGGTSISAAWGVSADGQVVVGLRNTSVDGEAFRWTVETGLVGLGFLPDAQGPTSRANATSADGSVVVGWSEGRFTLSQIGQQAFRWTAQDGTVGLGDLPGGSYISDARDVSADGNTVVGMSDSTSGREAFLWTPGDGMIGLGDLPGGNFDSQAWAVSSDGQVVVGVCDSAAWSLEPMRWSAEDGMISLGIAGSAYGTSADGSVIVGIELVAAGIQRAFIWDENNGVRRLQQLLELEFGLDLTGSDLRYAADVSADGLTIVGDGANPSGDREAWLARIDFGCSDGLDNDGDGLTDYPDVPGCEGVGDLSEHSPLLVCDDGSDNDGDELIDYPSDPGCWHIASNIENPQCQDGVNNDFNTGIDFDGGESVWGIAVDQPDPQCIGMPWRNREAPSRPCGLGSELVLLLPPQLWLSWRRRRRL